MPDKYDKKKSGHSGMKISMESVSNLTENLTSKGGFWFGLTLAFLAVAVLLSLGLWGYKITLVEEEESLIQKMDELAGQRDLDFENNLIDLKKKIDGLKNILSSRVYSSAAFTLLEELVVPGVHFTEFRGDLSTGKMVIRAEGNSFSDLDKQIVVFEENENIKGISVSSVGIGETGRVGSEIEIELKPGILYE